MLHILKNEDFLDNNIYESGIVAIENGGRFKVIHPNDCEVNFDLEELC